MIPKQLIIYNPCRAIKTRSGQMVKGWIRKEGEGMRTELIHQQMHYYNASIPSLFIINDYYNMYFWDIG